MKTYIGKVCAKHPKLEGLRRKANWDCVGCAKENDRERRKSPRAVAARTKLRDDLKLEVLKHYSYGDQGALRCRHCIENDIDVLTIDHEEGGGRQHRELIGGGGYRLYRWLRDNGFPPGYRTLCFNCNMKAHFRRMRAAQ